MTLTFCNLQSISWTKAPLTVSCQELKKTCPTSYNRIKYVRTTPDSLKNLHKIDIIDIYLNPNQT